MTGLTDYLAGPGSRSWQWGSLDCIQFACGWVVEATGRDPGAAFRGRYSTRTGANRFILKAGGMVALIAPCMAACGFQPTADPQSGDVGIVKALVGSHIAAVGAIRVGAYWAARGETSLFFQDFPLLAAWSIPQLQ